MNIQGQGELIGWCCEGILPWISAGSDVVRKHERRLNRGQKPVRVFSEEAVTIAWMGALPSLAWACLELGYARTFMSALKRVMKLIVGIGL